MIGQANWGRFAAHVGLVLQIRAAPSEPLRRPLFSGDTFPPFLSSPMSRKGCPGSDDVSLMSRYGCPGSEDVSPLGEQ